MKTVVIIGGGLSGIITAIQLARRGIGCTVLEKKVYPFHRVCGEYISNETVPFLRSLDLFPDQFAPASIDRFLLTSVNGKSVTLPLHTGGFGISRYTFDNFLYVKACEAGVNFVTGTEAKKIEFDGELFTVLADNASFTGDLVVGSFGKRSKIDIVLGRSFIKQRSPYLGVKYHLRSDHNKKLIALHNFQGGYCGISNVEEGKTNLCYLSHRDNLRKYGDLRTMEEQVLFKNPFLKSIFKNSEFLFDKPETINEISFETKGPIENHILMTGDAAGMITPLCGNGMAIAIRSSKILASLIFEFFESARPSRAQLETSYLRKWKEQFQFQLWTGRQIQRLFGSATASDLAVNIARKSKFIGEFLIERTHGKPF